ncbi:MAG: YihY/virulence factor BrkB family protein [Gaiellaceae bacterium]
MPSKRQSPRRHLVHELSRRFVEHELPIYASAIAFRALVATIPLALLGLGLLGALGLESTWTESIAPAIKPRVIEPVYDAINASAQKILSSGTAGLIAFATALVIWDLAIGIMAVMRALNHVHDVDEDRTFVRRALVAVGLALAVAACIVGSMLLLVAGPRAGGSLDAALGVLRWLFAPLLLALAIGLLVRFAPAQKPEARWASAGSLLVIAVWIVATELFRLWVTYVANFKTAIGSLTGLLLLTLYLLVSSAIFLVGAELDELLRKETRGRGVALPDLVTAVMRR